MGVEVGVQKDIATLAKGYVFYWLYDLEDVENEPTDYRFRMKIKKI